MGRPGNFERKKILRNIHFIKIDFRGGRGGGGGRGRGKFILFSNLNNERIFYRR
jgi:hypothetical protein